MACLPHLSCHIASRMAQPLLHSSLRANREPRNVGTRRATRAHVASASPRPRATVLFRSGWRFVVGWPAKLCDIERRMKMLIEPRSGSYQGITSSRNRYGQYVRTRATPVNPGSGSQGTVRGRMSVNAAAWRALTSGQIAGWESLGSQMVRTDALGQSYALNGFSAYVSVNNNNLAAGNAVVSDAPALITPSTVETVTITLTSSSFSIAYTPTPLGAGQRLFVYASPQRSAGRSYENDLRLVHVSAAAAASPANVLSAYTARFGAPVTGNRIFLAIAVYEGGFRSGVLRTSQVVA